jgi:hypothetical protein
MSSRTNPALKLLLLTRLVWALINPVLHGRSTGSAGVESCAGVEGNRKTDHQNNNEYLFHFVTSQKKLLPYNPPE